MFSSLACAADVPDRPVAAAAPAAASTEPVGTRNNDPDFWQQSSVKPCQTALIFSVEDDFGNLPEWMRTVPNRVEELKTGTVLVFEKPGKPECHMRYYTHAQLVIAFKTLLYLALCDSHGIRSNWHLGPVCFSKENPPHDAAGGGKPYASISLVKTGMRKGTDCSPRFVLPVDHSQLLGMLDSREIDALLDSLGDTFEDMFHIRKLSTFVRPITQDMLRAIRETTSLFSFGAFGVIRADKRTVYKASSAREMSSCVYEFINLAILKTKKSKHVPKLYEIGVNISPVERVYTENWPFITPAEDDETKLATQAKKLGMPAVILTESFIQDSEMLVVCVRRLHATGVTSNLQLVVAAVLKAISDILKRGIIHADLHGGNVLVRERISKQKRSYKAYIIDFGQAGPLFGNRFEGLDELEVGTTEEFAGWANVFTQKAPETTDVIDLAVLSTKTYSWQAALLVASIIVGFIVPNSQTLNPGGMLTIEDGNPVIRPVRVAVDGTQTEYSFTSARLRDLLDAATKLNPIVRIDFTKFRDRMLALDLADYAIEIKAGSVPMEIDG